MKLTQKQVGK